VIVRGYSSPSDALATLEVFTRAVRETARRDYTLEQVLAWAPSALPVLEWDARRAAASTRVAVTDDQIVGFTDVADDGYIDMLFVHPLYNGRGVASALLDSLGDGPLWTNASITARGFFAHRGFVVEEAQKVVIRGQVLTNYRMVRGGR
jgi:putative acetyltransferase